MMSSGDQLILRHRPLVGPTAHNFVNWFDGLVGYGICLTRRTYPDFLYPLLTIAQLIEEASDSQMPQWKFEQRLMCFAYSRRQQLPPF
jgi:hypothetical protein